MSIPLQYFAFQLFIRITAIELNTMHLLLRLATAISALAGKQSALTTQQAIANGTTLAYSEPFYPSPWMTGQGEWSDAYAQARDFVSQLTLLEKVK